MKQKMKQLIGILLSIALMLGMLPVMSLTAYADDPYAGIKNTTTVIHFDSKDWYLIDYDNSTVTLLSKEAVAKSKYNSSVPYVEYNDSDVKTVVDNWYNVNISAKAKDAVDGNKMFLLTTEQAQAIEAENTAVLKCPNYQDDWMWWLCSPGDGDTGNAAQVNGAWGNVVTNGCQVEFESLVRPALMLDLSKVVFSSESNTFSLIYSVNLTGGAKAGSSGGSLRQEVAAGNAMETVTFTAGTGYQFPATSDLYTTTSGITVERTSDTVVTVSGTPTDIEVNVKVPDAEAKTYALTLDNQGATKPGANSVTATYDAVLPSIADNLPSRTGYTFDGYFSEKNGSGKQYLKADGTPTEEKWTKDDGGTLYAGWTLKPEASVKETPKAKDLTYNGQAQELVTEGEAEGGTMQYAIGKDATTAPDDGWSEKIPTGTDAGTYYVWYKAKGDDGYTDSEAAYVEAKINAPEPGKSSIKNDSTLPEAEKDKAYDVTFELKDSTVQDLDWEITKGSLPEGLTLDSKTGKISGKPSKTGEYVFTIKEKNTGAEKEFTINVKDSDSHIDTKGDVDLECVQSEENLQVLDGSIGNLPEEDQQKVKEAREQGKDLDYEFETKELDEDDAEGAPEIKNYNNEKGLTLGKLFDISLLIRVKDTGDTLAKMRILNGKVTFTVSISEDLRSEGRIFYILRFHDGVEVVGKGQGDEVEAESDLFSTYAIAYTDSEEPEPDKKKSKSHKKDDTEEHKTASWILNPNEKQQLVITYTGAPSYLTAGYQEQGAAAAELFKAAVPVGWSKAFSFNVLDQKRQPDLSVKNGTMTLSIPGEYIKAGRQFALLGMNKTGQVISFADTDRNPNTVTVNLANMDGYAFELIYKD